MEHTDTIPLDAAEPRTRPVSASDADELPPDSISPDSLYGAISQRGGLELALALAAEMEAA